MARVGGRRLVGGTRQPHVLPTHAPATLIPGTNGDLWWGGMASTFFWIDPAEDLIVTLMTQMIPSGAYPIRRELRTLVYSAFTESSL